MQATLGWGTSVLPFVVHHTVSPRSKNPWTAVHSSQTFALLVRAVRALRAGGASPVHFIRILSRYPACNCVYLLRLSFLHEHLQFAGKALECVVHFRRLGPTSSVRSPEAPVITDTISWIRTLPDRSTSTYPDMMIRELLVQS